MAGQVRVEEMNTPELRQDCGCGCGGALCGTAGGDCGCGCGGALCGSATQELVLVGSLADRDPNGSVSRECDCGCECCA